jgi:hypothetical protein
MRWDRRRSLGNWPGDCGHDHHNIAPERCSRAALCAAVPLPLGGALPSLLRLVGQRETSVWRPLVGAR